MAYNELYHHGVLGQKWGVRRYQNKDGTLTAEGKRRAASDNPDSSQTSKDGDASTKQSSYRKSVKQMSDDELKQKIERLKLEKEYRATKEGSKGKGSKFVQDVAEQIGKNALTNIGTQAVNSGLTHLANKFLNKILSGNMSEDDSSKMFNELKFYTNNKKGK